MHRPHISAGAAPAGTLPAPRLSAFLLPVLRTLRGTRGVGVRLSQKTKSAFKGAKPLCPVLDHVVDEAIADPRVSTDALLRIPAAQRAFIRVRRSVRVLPFVDACVREQRAHCAVDPVQLQAVGTRSPGDLAALAERLALQIEASDDLLTATLAELERVTAPVAGGSTSTLGHVA